MTFWQKAEQFPPVRVRLMARQFPGGPPLTNAEIALITGLMEFEVASISRQINWTGVDLPTMRKFLVACGVDFENPASMKRVQQYLRGKVKGGIRVPPRFADMQNAPHWDSELRPLAELFLRSCHITAG